MGDRLASSHRAGSCKRFGMSTERMVLKVALVGNGVLDLAVALVPGLAQNGLGKAFNPWLRSFGEPGKTAVATELHALLSNEIGFSFLLHGLSSGRCWCCRL